MSLKCLGWHLRGIDGWCTAVLYLSVFCAGTICTTEQHLPELEYWEMVTRY